MPRDGAVVLPDLRSSTLSIVCEPCGRRGTYNVARLMVAALFRWRRKNRGLAGLATTAPLHRWAIHTAMSASDRETVPDDGRQPTNERKRK